MLTLKDGRTELWQWDTGRELKIDGECSQVHFSNKIQGRSIDVDVIDGVAKIPDVLLQTDGKLNVWAFVGTAENGYTKISKVFVVNKRNRPADYVFTPIEQTNLRIIEERLLRLEQSGGVSLEIDEETLIFQDGKLKVNTTDEVKEDNTQPITSAGVAVTVGNIEVLLKTI